MSIQRATIAFVVSVLLPCAAAQTPVMTVGDSITNGGQTYVSWRYPLWFDLQAGGYAVDFVGGQTTIFGGNPNLTWYPNYLSTFDRDHEGYWGWRTDQIAGIITASTTSAQPDIVTIHLGTNDIGQLGAAGVTNADTNLRLIIDRIRAVRPNVTILLAQVIPIGPGTSYFNNAGQVGPLNTTIATIASDMDLPGSPIILVDQNTGFDLNTMMQSDGLHPNLAGEAQMASVWLAALSSILTPGNFPPTVAITAPSDGASFSDPASINIAATASDPDPNGFVTQVEFFAGANLLGTDTTEPFEYAWSGVSAGNYILTAVATDNDGNTRTSTPVVVTVAPFVDGTSIAITNPSFEDPPLADGALAEGAGVIGGWTFSGTTNTFLGIFNPPVGSYPDASGTGTPLGADGANVAFLFNNGGPSEEVSATQVLTETLRANVEYQLTVAIGRFLPNQPYAFSTYGGYRIELLAGGTVIASDVDTVDPNTGSFTDAFVSVSANELDPNLIGQPLSLYLNISADEEDRSTHFDHVRLLRRSLLVGDGDDDGDVDMDDVELYLNCMNGPGNAPAPTPPTSTETCTSTHDFDTDDDIDMNDAAALQLGFTG